MALEQLEIDPSSDYFRYPITKKRATDKGKSPFKEVPIGALMEMPADRPDEKVKALVVENAQGEYVRSFRLDTSTNREEAKVAWKAADVLGGFHAMMRFEYTDGW